jgi:hypothetical protein
MRKQLRSIDLEAKPMRPDGRQIGAARDQRHVDTRTCQLNADVAADRTSADHAYFHGFPSIATQGQKAKRASEGGSPTTFNLRLVLTLPDIRNTLRQSITSRQKHARLFNVAALR